jgi:hypothetical protein
MPRPHECRWNGNRHQDLNEDVMELKTQFYVKTNEKLKGISRIEGKVNCPKNQ